MRAALVLLMAAITALALAPAATAHRGPIPKYTYAEGCRGFIDPVGILFYGRTASATRAAQISDRVYPGMKTGDDDSQHFVTHGNCLSTQRAVDDGCPACNRTHMRIGGLRSPRTGRYYRDRRGRIFSVGTPHTDRITFACSGPLPDHVNPTNGFRDARRRFVRRFRRARFRVSHVRLKSTRRRRQCDGSYAQGDGLVAKVSTSR